MTIRNKKEPSWVQRNRDRSNARYHRMKDENHQLLIADTLLKYLSDKFGLNVFIPAEKFFDINFPFGISTDVRAKYSACDIVINKYCYIIFSNHTIKIFKL